MSKVVNIVMTASGWQKCKSSGNETWTCNNGYKLARVTDNLKITKNFLMHKQVYTTVELGKEAIFDFNDMQQASEQYGFQIVSWHDIKEFKNPEKFPFTDLCKFFKTTYFASSHCYMIAYALYKGFDRIRMFGMGFVNEVSKHDDDLWERCGTEYWIGRAEGMGIPVEVHLPSPLLVTRTGEPYALNG